MVLKIKVNYPHLKNNNEILKLNLFDKIYYIY